MHVLLARCGGHKQMSRARGDSLRHLGDDGGLLLCWHPNLRLPKNCGGRGRRKSKQHPGIILLCASPQQRAIEANGRDETLQEEQFSRPKRGRCAAGAMCGGTGVFGVSEGGQSTTEQLKDILTGVKAKRCLQEFKTTRFGFGWRRKGR